MCKLSNERLGLLEEALPLASHFSETHADLQSWLGEIEAEINSIDVPTGGDTSSEQIRKQQDNAKVRIHLLSRANYIVIPDVIKCPSVCL